MGRSGGYTADEDDIIRAHYPTEPRAVWLALLSGRSAISIKSRAWALGVRRQHRCGGDQIPCDGPVLAALTEAERGYLAGLIDGEGCLRLSRSKSAQGKPVYHIVVIISTTSKLRAQAELLANGYIHLTDDEREAVYQRLAE